MIYFWKFQIGAEYGKKKANLILKTDVINHRATAIN